jgi:hypothetical protein
LAWLTAVTPTGKTATNLLEQQVHNKENIPKGLQIYSFGTQRKIIIQFLFIYALT